MEKKIVFYGEYKNIWQKQGWKAINGTYNAMTKMIKIEKREYPKVEDFMNGKREYIGLQEVLEAFGEIKNEKHINVRYGANERKIELKNGMTIQVNRTNEFAEDGTYNYEYIAMSDSEARNSDLFIRVSYNGKYIAWAWSKNYVDSINCNDGIKRDHFVIGGIREI